MATREIVFVGEWVDKWIELNWTELWSFICTDHFCDNLSPAHIYTISLKIRFAEEKSGGTQMKMTMHFDNGMLALAKPMRSVH